MNVSSLHKTAKDAVIGKESVKKSHYINVNDDDEKKQNFLFNKRTQTPLMNRVYRNRMIGIEKLKSSLMTAFQQLNYPLDQVQYLVLGAGFDTAINTNQYATFYVDYPPVIEERKNLCSQYDQNARLISCDIRNSSLLFRLLEENGFKLTSPTVIICECVLSYIDLVSVQNLLTSISTKIPRSCIIIYDPMLGHPYGENLRQTFASRNVSLLSAMNSTLDMTLFLRNCDFRHIHSLSIQQFLHSISIPQQFKTEISEPFDEFAELAILNQLYAFTYCTNSQELFDCLNQNLFIWFESRTSSIENCQNQLNKQISTWNLLRYELLKNRLLSFEMKFHLSSGPPSNLLQTTPPPRSEPTTRVTRQSQTTPEDTKNPSTTDSKLKQKQIKSKQVTLNVSLNNTLTQSERRRNIFEYSIREANSNDLKNILLLFSDSYREYVEKYKSVRSYVKKCSQNIKSSLQCSELTGVGDETESITKTYFWVAEPPQDSSKLPTPLCPLDRKKGAIVGCVALKLTESGVGLLSHLCVRDAHRNRGVGFNLIQHVVETAWRKCCVGIELTTLEDMKPARHLYQLIGFHELNISDIGGGCKLVHMALNKK